MMSLEIPREQDRKGHYRFFEILPGALSWSMLALPFILSFIDVRIAALFRFSLIFFDICRTVLGVTRNGVETKVI
jgi:hypothetical protein